MPDDERSRPEAFKPEAFRAERQRIARLSEDVQRHLEDACGVIRRADELVQRVRARLAARRPRGPAS